MRWTLGLAVSCALVVAAGACGSSITVPDQGVIVTGCQNPPGQCWRSDCDCTRASIAAGSCVDKPTMDDPNDPTTWHCEPNNDLSVGGHDSQCLEQAQACIGRGVLCTGAGALCKAPGSTCDGTGDLPMLIPTFGMPMLEPHCQFVNDICCPGSSVSDGGVMTD